MTKRFKIEPDLTCPELAGYKLPPCSRCQEDGVVKKLSDLFTSVGHNFEIAMPELKEGLIELCKAREKFEFTESDLRQAVALSLDDAEKSVIWSKEWYPNKLADKIIASLRTPRTPIAIDVEYELDEFPLTNPDGTVKGRWVYE